MSQSALFGHFNIRKASLSELLIKLQNQWLFIREKMEDNRRNYQVSLSDKALQEFAENEEIPPHHKRHHHKRNLEESDS